MDAAANAILEVAKCLWASLAEPISYIYNPTKNLKSLEDELQRLENRRVDIKNQVEAEEVGQGGERTEQVKGWLEKVQNLLVESDRFVQEGMSYQHSKCLVWCCPTNHRSSYKLGKRISELLADVKKAQEDKFDRLVNRAPPQVPWMPTEETVGLDSMLSLVWNWLNENHVGVIGLWGMGGVGKTTLLKKINEKLRGMRHEFRVLWVVVSSQANLEKIRESIRKDLGIKDDLWSNLSEDGAKAELCRVLNTKRFVLLMDDLWEPLKLADIGIPIPNLENGSKIVFTTRFEELCGEMEGKMEAKKICKVECLPSRQALELFQQNVGLATINSHPQIRQHAEDIIEECKGLPLALITIGRAMATKKNPREWEYALMVLRSCPSEFSRMEDKVYKLLEFSYQSLKNPTFQRCFLYCALFPEDYNIRKFHLIGLWIGEGFLCATNDTYGARLEGESVIGSLMSACLLQEGGYESTVKMHDVIRDMALWIAREHGKERDRIIVEEEDVRMSKWEEAERVSLQSKRIKIDRFRELYECSRLVTLLINDTELETLPESFFNSMPILKVLDMSRNRSFKKLPAGIGGLVKLHYLNLSLTSIKVLPDEMKYLTSLQYLLLDFTMHLKNIPKEVISSLLSLKVYTKCYFNDEIVGDEIVGILDERGLVEGLEGLDQLDELSIEVRTDFSAQKMLESPNLQRSITDLWIQQASDLIALKILVRKVLRLNFLKIEKCDSLESIEICEGIPRHVNEHPSRGLELRNLHIVCIYRCNKLRNLSWLIYAPNLQTLDVQKCNTLEKIIDEEILQHVDENASARLFSSLTGLHCSGLPKLRSIHNRTLSSPSLKLIHIHKCLSLKKLPFDSNSGRNSLETVIAKDEWWSGLEWDDEAAKDFFTSKLNKFL